MHYEHLVAVNNPNNSSGFSISRKQLWQGLMLRVESPQLFIPNVEHVALQERTEHLILREMQLGVLLVRDTIRLQQESQIDFLTEPGEHHQGGRLVLTIEEPEPTNLFVRFCYNTPSSSDPEETKYESYLQKMWHQVDVECIRIIRGLAESGRLDNGCH